MMLKIEENHGCDAKRVDRVRPKKRRGQQEQSVKQGPPQPDNIHCSQGDQRKQGTYAAARLLNQELSSRNLDHMTSQQVVVPKEVEEQAASLRSCTLKPEHQAHIPAKRQGHQ